MESNLKSLNKYRQITILLSVIGFTLSYYSVYVAREKLKDLNYRAFCDISERFSCSPVFISPFGTGFGVVEKILGKGSYLSQSNGIYGYALYSIIILCGLFQEGLLVAKVQVLTAFFGGIASTYGFINAFWISPYFCLVCLTLHSANYVLLLISSLKLRQILRITQVDPKKSE